MLFKPSAVSGGAVGATVKLALTKGVARGLFSNEAGMGSTPHAHAVAKVEHPVEQGFVAMIGVFIDTFRNSESDGTGDYYNTVDSDRAYRYSAQPVCIFECIRKIR